MIKASLLLLSCLTIFAQRTPLSVNGTVVNNPNLTNTASVTWSVTGPNIRGTASAGSDSFWTNSSVASGSIQPVGGSNVYMPGTLAVVGQLTNDALQASQLVYSGPDKVLSSISPGNSGDVLTSSGPGIAPSFLPVSGGDTIWTNDNGTISATSTEGLRWQWNGTNKFQVNTNAELTLGPILGYAFLQDNPAIHLTQVRSLDGQSFADFSIQAAFKPDDLNTLAGVGQLDIAVNGASTDGGNNSYVYWEAAAFNELGRKNGFTMNIDGSADSIDWTFYSDEAAVTVFAPVAADGTTTYILNTAISHTTGNLVEVKNAGNDRFSISHDGSGSFVGSLNVGGSGVSVFTNGITSRGPITITNANTAVVPFTINHAASPSARAFDVNIGGVNYLNMSSAGNVAGAGSLDMTMDIRTARDFRAGSGRIIYWISGTVLDSPADGTLRVSQNSSRTAYGKAQLVGLEAGLVKQLTDASATTAFYVSVPTLTAIGGRVQWEVVANDGTDIQSLSGSTQFDAVGKSTTVTANVTTAANTSTPSAGTLTVAVTANVTTNNVFALQWNADTSLSTTNLVVRWRTESPTTMTINAL